MNVRENLQSLLETENLQQQKLNEIVFRSIEEEKLISQKLCEFEETNSSLKNRISDKIASFGGSWSFIIFFIAMMAMWIVLNLYLASKPFDPYPFILLNL